MELAIAGLVAGTAVVMQSLEERQELLAVLQPRDLGLTDLLGTLPCYGSLPARMTSLRWSYGHGAHAVPNGTIFRQARRP
jgi:hypothetical protein